MISLRVVSLIFVFCVVVVCRQTPGDGTGQIPDESIAVSVNRNEDSVSASKFGSCSRKSSAYNVRFQEIESRTTIFKRVMLYMKAIEWYSDMETVHATTIKTCADKTFDAGHAGFHFNNGVCGMFTPRHQFCRCDAGRGDAIYVQDFFWDAKDRVLPKYFLNGNGSLVGETRYPSAILDQMLNQPFLRPNMNIPSSSSPQYPGRDFPIFLNGEMVSALGFLDTDSCFLECGVPSKYTVHHLVNFDHREMNQEIPPIYMLSQCGKTIEMKAISMTTPAVAYVMSHKGASCDWYPKPEEDHSCVVTLDKPGTTFGSIQFIFALLDGEHIITADCLGDFVEVYQGNNTDPANLAMSFSFCRKVSEFNMRIEPPVTFVFNRTATQHQTKNQTNFGFSLLYFAR